jgi:hypothetical protein
MARDGVLEGLGDYRSLTALIIANNDTYFAHQPYVPGRIASWVNWEQTNEFDELAIKKGLYI